MATVAEIQAQLGLGPYDAQIIRSEYGVDGANLDRHLVVGKADGGGRTRWIGTTSTDNAATQAAAIITGLNTIVT